jgi:hypothetical protein
MYIKPNDLEELLKKSREVLDSLKSKFKIPSKQKVIILAWGLLLKNTDAICCLIKSGFHAEAFVIQRLSIEHFFNIVALIEDKNEEFYEKFKQESLRSYNDLYESLHDNVDPNNLCPQRQNGFASIDKFQVKYKNKLTIQSKAKLINKKFDYEVIYKLISKGYAHSTCLSITKETTQEDIDLLFKQIFLMHREVLEKTSILICCH